MRFRVFFNKFFFLVFICFSCFKADENAPVIFLKFVSDSYISIGSDYQEPGYTAKDDRDGDITYLVEIKGEVNNHLAGSYELFYNVADASGNIAKQARRQVYVRHRNFTLEGLYQTRCSCSSNNGDTLLYYSSIKSSGLNEDEIIIDDFLKNQNSSFTGYLNDVYSQKIVFKNMISNDTLYSGFGQVSADGKQIKFQLIKENNLKPDTCQVLLIR
jgi:hypothetical protein